MSLTVAQKLNIADISQYLCNVDIAKGGLYGKGIDLMHPMKIMSVRKSVQNRYDRDPTDTTLEATSNYMLSLCYKWLSAAQIINSGGGSTGSGTVQVIKSPLPITGADFATSTAWNGTNSDGITIRSTYTLQIFWNDIQRFLQEGTEWNRTSAGFEIINNGVTISGFDASANPTYSLYVYISL